MVGGESVGDDEDGWIETPVEEVVEKGGRMKVFALDCEMVSPVPHFLSASANELTDSGPCPCGGSVGSV